MNKFEFTQLHNPNQPLVLLNVWNQESAQILEKLNSKVIATSSYSTAVSQQIEDGENLKLSTQTGTFKTVKQQLFKTLDFEAGYAKDLSELHSNVEFLLSQSIQGINIEDKQPRTDELLSEEAFIQKINCIRNADTQNELFINARSDSFFYGDIGLKNKDNEYLKKTIERINHYEKATIDGIFLPGLKNKDFIQTITRNISIPLNIMLDITSDNLEDYLSLGVARISFGPSTFFDYQNSGLSVANYFEETAKKLTPLQQVGKINLTTN